MTEPKQVTELDLGETLIIQGDKVHVNIDGATIVAENGVLKAVLPSDSPITLFELSPTGTLQLGVRGAVQPLTVDLTNLVPAAQADRFLSGVTFNKRTKEFVFTTSKDGAEEQEFKVPLSAFADELLQVSNDSGNILELRTDGLYVACCNSGGGSTDLGDVPEKPFEEGSKILAFDANGNLYKFAQNAAYEKDVAVTLEVLSNQILDNGKNVAEVAVYVHNNLHTTAEDVQLNVGTSAQILSGDVSPLPFTISSYGRNAYSFTVEYDTSSYMTATVSAVGDAVSSNNTATVSLPFNVRQTYVSANNVFTKECPLVVATYNGEPLLASAQAQSTDAYDRSNAATNVIMDVNKPNLNGVTLNLLGASRVVVIPTEGSSRGSYYGRVGGSFVVLKDDENTYRSFANTTPQSYRAVSSNYTFNLETGDLTFLNNFGADNAYIFIRPAGENCLWQVYYVVCNGKQITHNEVVSKVAISSLPEDAVQYETVNESYSTSGDPMAKTFDELTAVTANTNIKYFGSIDGAKTFSDLGYWDQQTFKPLLLDTDKSTNQRLVVNLCENNLPVTFDVKSTQGLTPTRGHIEVTLKEENYGNAPYNFTYTVTVNSGATTTDNYTSGTLKIVLGECSSVSPGTTSLDDVSENPAYLPPTDE